jgi:FHA domain-containing protein/uncharacterized protein DUF1707
MGGSAAQPPASPDEPPAGGLRASDAEREQVVGRLRDEFVAGRLSHETFLHRVNVVLAARRQADLPPVLADLPAPLPARSPGAWLRGTWHRLTSASPAARKAREGGPGRESGQQPVARARGDGRSLTSRLRAAPEPRPPLELRFPRGVGRHFSIGRDESCDLAIADMSVSRRHAQLERTADGWLLTDLESTNGTRVNGWRVRGRVPVRPGDLVSFGSLEAVFFPGE